MFFLSPSVTKSQAAQDLIIGDDAEMQRIVLLAVSCAGFYNIGVSPEILRQDIRIQ